jgi:hypothetical protein
MDWTDEPIDTSVWKRVRGNPFADYDPADGIALWSLWEMPSSAVGALVRRGRSPSEPTEARTLRLPVSTWKRLERQAEDAHTSIEAIVRERLG